jgi:hypothetical protein
VTRQANFFPSARPMRLAIAYIDLRVMVSGIGKDSPFRMVRQGYLMRLSGSSRVDVDAIMTQTLLKHTRNCQL